MNWKSDSSRAQIHRTLLLLFLFAVAMALLEAAVVVYMRQLYYPDNPLEIFPLTFLQQIDWKVELSREVATIVMIVTIALLAEQRTRTRQFGAFVFVFGLWDFFYYLWLKLLIGWPVHWLEWDVLFLIPMVWLGPWICPALISVLFIAWGGLAMLTSARIAFTRGFAGAFILGAVLGVLAFHQPVLVTLREGGDRALEQYLPGSFWWWLYWLSLGLMAGALIQTYRAAVRSERMNHPPAP